MNVKIKKSIGFILKYRILIVVVIAVIAVVIITLNVVSCSRHNNFSLGADNHIDITPEQIRSVEAIGEWEFLSVSDEEFVDTVRKGIFSNDKLARIYEGTLRLGVDMQKVKEGWLTAHGDTLVAELPKIQLLDNRFVDEARTRSFYESGRWSAADREAMYQRAYHLMVIRCMTTDNIRNAEQNARLQFTKLFNSMGFNNVSITFDD